MLNFSKDILLHLKEFLIHPSDSEEIPGTFSIRLQNFLFILLIDLIISFFIIFVIFCLKQLNTGIPEYNDISSLIRLYPIWLTLVLIIFLEPLFEEFIFRFGLRNQRFYLFHIPVNFINFFRGSDNPELENRFRTIWNRYYTYIFYSSAILFCLSHLFNYEKFTFAILFFPVIVFPQFVLGLLAGYLRIKFNFFWGLLLHIFHNAIFLLLALMAMSGTTERLSLKTKDFSLKITEVNSKTNRSDYSASDMFDTLKTQNTKLREILPEILDFDRQFIMYNSNHQSNITLNIDYVSTIKGKKANSDTIMNYLKDIFQFEVKNSYKNLKTWILRVKDTLKLNKYISGSKSNSCSQSTTREDDIIFINSNFYEIVQFAANQFSKNIKQEINSATKYTIKFKAGDFDEFRKNALEKMGLLFEPAYLSTKVININFTY